MGAQPFSGPGRPAGQIAGVSGVGLAAEGRRSLEFEEWAAHPSAGCRPQ